MRYFTLGKSVLSTDNYNIIAEASDEGVAQDICDAMNQKDKLMSMDNPKDENFILLETNRKTISYNPAQEMVVVKTREFGSTFYALVKETGMKETLPDILEAGYIFEQYVTTR